MNITIEILDLKDPSGTSARQIAWQIKDIILAQQLGEITGLLGPTDELVDLLQSHLDCLGYVLFVNTTSLDQIKNLTESLEHNKRSERVADIDIYRPGWLIGNIKVARINS